MDHAAICMRNKNYVGALRAYQQVLADDPNHDEAQRGVEEAEAEAETDQAAKEFMSYHPWRDGS